MSHDKHGLEVEASCLAWEENGSKLAGESPAVVVRYLGGDTSVVARDGTCRAGRRDRLGRPLSRGRGMGIFDIIVPCEVASGAMDWVPVSVKGCHSTGYGNRDLTQHYEVVLRHAEAGRSLWVFLVRPGQGGGLEMRRIDASKVIREAPDCWLVRDDVRKYTRKDGTEVTKVYKRLRFEWARVAKRHPHLFLDEAWRSFTATLPPCPY